MTASRAAHRMSKRMQAARRRHGNCCICTHREKTDGVLHCRGNAQRAMGLCEDDGQRPRFKVDDEAVEAFRDAT